MAAVHGEDVFRVKGAFRETRNRDWFEKALTKMLQAKSFTTEELWAA